MTDEELATIDKMDSDQSRQGWGELRFHVDLSTEDFSKLFSIVKEHNEVFQGDGPYLKL